MANEAQAKHWSEIAPGWLAAAPRRQLIGGDLGRLPMQRLDLQPGEQVLDIGCGSGTTTLELAELVGSGGHVVGVDLVPEMIDYARGLAAPETVEFVQADVQTADLGEQRFDAAY